MSSRAKCYVDRVVLVILEGQDVLDKLMSPRFGESKFQYIDEVAKEGYSTTIMHPDTPCMGGAPSVFGNDLFGDLKTLAKKIMHSNEAGEEKAYKGKDPQPAHPGVVFLESENVLESFGIVLCGAADQPVVVIKAGNGVEGTDAFIHIVRQFQRGEESALGLSDVLGNAEGGMWREVLDELEKIGTPSRGKLLLGVCAVGKKWTDHTHGKFNVSEIFPVVQSSQVALEDSKVHKLPTEESSFRQLKPVGSVSWVGRGVCKEDEGVAFDGAAAPADDALFLSQIFREALSKAGVVPKFGA